MDSDVDQAVEKLQRALTAIEEWCDMWDMSINASKSAIMFFTRKRIRLLPTLHMNGNIIPLRTRQRYLGLTLDGPLLTWQPHISNLINTCTTRLNVMKSLSGTKWGCSRALLLQFYLAYIRSRIDYGASIYSSACPTLLKRLTRYNPISSSTNHHGSLEEH